MPARRLLLAAALTLVTPAAAHAAGPGSTLLVDRPTGLGALPFDGANNSSLSAQPQLSADGRYAVFASDADQLLAPGADPTVQHVFVRDRVTDTTTQLDVGAGGVAGNDDAYTPTISADGTAVAFASDATNLTADAVTTTNVFVKSLTSGTVTLVSRQTGAAGTPANGAYEPSISADGSHVAFTAWVSLDAADTNGASDVYVRSGSTTTLVSRATGAGGAVGTTGGAEAPSISGDDTTVAFQSTSALDPGSDGNGTTDVYTRAGTTTTLVSRLTGGAATAAGNGPSYQPSIATNGSVVAFASSASDLVAGDTNSRTDVFTRAGTTTALQSGETGTNAPSNGDTYDPRISPDGTRVGFSSYATDLVPGVTGSQYRTYLRTIATSTTTLISRADGAAGVPVEGSSPSFSANGTVVAFGGDDDAAGGAGDGNDDVFVRDTAAGTTEVASIPTGTTVRRAGTQDARLTTQSVSDDGRRVAFVSDSDGLGLQSRTPQLYVRDTVTNATTRIDTEGTPSQVAISGDGTTVVYAAAPTTTLVRGLPAGTNVYAYSTSTGATTVVGRATGASGDLPNGTTFGPSVNRDGTKVAFSTWASNLDPVADGNTDEDLYVRDLTASTTTLVSRKDGAGTPSGTGRSFGASIDAEGRRVAFSSYAVSLAPGDDALGSLDVFVRDVTAGTTTLVSRPTGAGTGAGNNGSRDAAIDGSGTKVAFGSTATDLSPDDASPDADVYLRDLATNTTTLLSRVGASGPSASQPAYVHDLSGDGSTVAYATNAPNVLGTTVDQQLIVVRTIADGATTIGSRGDGAAGALPLLTTDGALTADGGCLAFGAKGSALTPGGYPSSDYVHVYLRGLTRECPTPVPSPPGDGGGPSRPGTAGGLQTTKPPAPDTTAPTISAATISPRTFAVVPLARAAQRRRVARGTSVRFTLSEPASVVLTAQRRERGRRSGRRCVKSTARLRERKAKACTRYVAKGTVRVAGKAGANRVAYTGRIGRRALPRGSFRLQVDATDAARNKAKPRTIAFTIVKG